LRPTRTIREFFEKGDVVLLLLCILASVMGLVLIYSATQYLDILHGYAMKQAMFLCLGIAAYVWVTFIDIEFLMEKWWWVFLLLGLCVIALIYPFGEGGDSGNKSWVYLPIPHFPGFQPGEIAKLAYIVVLAWLINRERPRGLGRFSAIVKYGVLTCTFAGALAVLSSDWGMVIVYLFIFMAMAWVAGVSKWWFIGVGAPLAGALVFLWRFILPRTKYWTDYRIMRFRVVVEHWKGNNLEPQGAGWQQNRSLLAIGSGRLTGMGFLNGTQTHSPYRQSLPARHTDNIFAVCGEEFGLLGCCAVLLVLLLIILRCIWVSRRAKSHMSAYIAMGIAAMLMIQTVINVAMCLYVGPVIGVTLPFFSYGGSSTLTLFIAMGLVSGIKMRPLPSWLKDRSQL
jgi:rod shape determining protein RodA